MTTHEGHRQRLRRRFLLEGLDNFDEVQVLELLLFYAIPRRDTNPIAHALLEQFGSLSGVLEAPVSALAQVPGMGENGATLLQLVTAASRYYMIQRSSAGQVLNTVERCGAYLTPRFFGLRDEAVCALCLDAKCKPLACRILGWGSVNAAGVPIRKIVEFALSVNATSVVLAHNHPSGIATTLPGGHRRNGAAEHRLGRRGHRSGRPHHRLGRGLCLHGRLRRLPSAPVSSVAPVTGTPVLAGII